MKFDEYIYDISENLVPAIFYGDYSGLDDSEYEYFMHFIECDMFNNGHWAIPDTSESEFTRCDILGLYADCIRLIFYKIID